MELSWSIQFTTPIVYVYAYSHEKYKFFETGLTGIVVFHLHKYSWPHNF